MTQPPSPPSDLESASPNAPDLAAQALSEVLRPLARLMIDHGLQLPAAVELMKMAFVREAEASYALSHKDTSDTRIALLTGVHRKDVKRLRATTRTASTAANMLPLAASVVARWISEPRYLQADQTPRALARTPGRSTAGEPDFTELVAEVTRDVGARAVLDELLRLGVAAVQDGGLVVLTGSGFVPHEGLDESFQFLAANIHDHLSAAVHNLKPGRTQPSMLDQSAFSHDLSAQQVEQLQQQARRLWTTTLQSFLQTATVAEQRSVGVPGPKHRVRLGVYFYSEALPAPEHAAATAAKSKRKKSEPT